MNLFDKLKQFGRLLYGGFNSIGEGFYSIGGGMSNIFYPNIKPKILSEQEASKSDYDALKSDWDKVGGDLEKAMRCINHN